MFIDIFYKAIVRLGSWQLKKIQVQNPLVELFPTQHETINPTSLCFSSVSFNAQVFATTAIA